MIEIDKIQSIVNDVIEASKDLYIWKDGSAIWKDVPEYYEGYKEAVNQKNRIETHADVDSFPETLFKHRAPNQNDKENEYIENNYKNTTHPAFVDYLSVVSRGLNDHNWEIIYPQGGNDAEDYRNYVNKEIDVFNSVEKYVKEIVPTLRGTDANGVSTFKLNDVSFVEVDGEMVQDDTKKLEPQPMYYGAEQVVAWEWNKYGLFESHEKSMVMYASKKYEIGRVFYFYDDTNIWKVEQVGKFVEHTYEYTLVFAHELDMFPCVKMKGVPKIKKDGDIYYTSRFYYSVDLLDWSLLYSNYLNAQIANVCFPMRWAVGDDCDFTDNNGVQCFDGHIITENGKADCPQCHGSGQMPRFSSMGTYLLKGAEGLDKGDTSFNVPMGYVAPNTDTLSFTKETAKEYFEQAKSMLHIHTSNSNVKGSEDMTATGMSIDMKAMYAFVLPDSDQTFDIFQFQLDVIGKVRYGKDFEGAKLVYPKSFDFRTDADILEDIKVARDSKLPSHVISSLTHQYLRNRFYSEQSTNTVSQVIEAADRILTLSNEEIIQRKTLNTVEAWEIVLHDSGFKLVNDLIGENPLFLDLEIEEQVSLLVAKARETTPKDLATTRAEGFAARLIEGN